VVCSYRVASLNQLLNLFVIMYGNWIKKKFSPKRKRTSNHTQHNANTHTLAFIQFKQNIFFLINFNTTSSNNYYHILFLFTLAFFIIKSCFFLKGKYQTKNSSTLASTTHSTYLVVKIFISDLIV
jgi:hypothetical protein